MTVGYTRVNTSLLLRLLVALDNYASVLLTIHVGGVSEVNPTRIRLKSTHHVVGYMLRDNQWHAKNIHVLVKHSLLFSNDRCQ